jgi:hypothetical protein
MMTKTYRPGAVGALLDEYEKAIAELQQVLQDVSNEELISIADSKTDDPNCKSIQTILSHVVRSGYSYAIYILNMKGDTMERPALSFHLSVKDYYNDLNDVFSFTADVFKDINDTGLEEYDGGKKIMTSWGQLYNIEQIAEHAIVHILRHRRQIEKFKIVLRTKNLRFPST